MKPGTFRWQNVRRWVLGPAGVPQQCLLAIRDPQDEVQVWAEGPWGICDVTRDNFVASASPLTIGLNLKTKVGAAELAGIQPLLRFKDGRTDRVLGEIRLHKGQSMEFQETSLYFFETRGSSNYCVPRIRLWLRYAEMAYKKWAAERKAHKHRVRMRLPELRSIFTFYICPRPTVVVSVRHDVQVNLFPMDLMGSFGDSHFALALHNTSAPLPLLEKSCRAAISTVPFERSAVAFNLGANHRKAAIDLETLPFETTASETFGLPVPRFSPRVRELQVERIHKLGHYTLFLTTIVSDVRCWQDLEMFQAHGFYQAWKESTRSPFR